MASDGGSPPETDTTVVLVNVDRNLHAPVLAEPAKNITILETRDLGVSFVTVSATDEDQKVRE